MVKWSPEVGVFILPNGHIAKEKRKCKGADKVWAGRLGLTVGYSIMTPP